MHLINSGPTSLSWLLVESIMALIAASGGIVVFWGLWLEKKAVKDDYASIIEYRASKQKAERGWRILMLGIAIEIIVGVVLAARDAWEFKQLEAAIAKNDPLKQPITDVTALVLLEVRNGDSTEIESNPFLRQGVPWTAYLTLRESNRQPIRITSGPLVADNFTKSALGGAQGPTADRAYSMRFHLEDLGLREREDLAERIDDVSMLTINTFFLRTNAHILGGRVRLVVNSQLQRYYNIVPQRDFHSTDTSIGITVVATNTTRTLLVQHYVR